MTQPILIRIGGRVGGRHSSQRWLSPPRCAFSCSRRAYLEEGEAGILDYDPTTEKGHFQLLPRNEKAGEAEDRRFEGEACSVKDWWDKRRYNGIKRPYSVEDVVSKRGTLPQTYPSSLMARKLYELLYLDGERPIHTSKA